MSKTVYFYFVFSSSAIPFHSADERYLALCIQAIKENKIRSFGKLSDQTGRYDALDLDTALDNLKIMQNQGRFVIGAECEEIGQDTYKMLKCFALLTCSGSEKDICELTTPIYFTANINEERLVIREIDQTEEEQQSKNIDIRLLKETIEKIKATIDDPIQLEPMTNPVILVETGLTYDQKSLEEWFAQREKIGKKPTDPITGQKLTDTRFIPNRSLKQVIEYISDLENMLTNYDKPWGDAHEKEKETINHQPTLFWRRDFELNNDCKRQITENKDNVTLKN